MRPGLLILPFLAILVAALGAAFGSAFPEVKWIAQVAWALAFGIVGLWVALDLENFKAIFARKGAKYGASSGLVVLLGMVVIVGLAVVTARPRFNKSIDLTRDRLNTLSEQSLKLIETIKRDGKKITITGYFADDEAQKPFRDLLQLYTSAGADFAVEWVDPNTNPTRAVAEKVTDPNTVIIRQGDQEKRLSAFSEEKMTNALVNVLKDKSKKIYFTKGHGEPPLRASEATGLSAIVTELENNKDAVAELSLLEAAKVPADADVVVIAGPKYDFKEEEIRMLEDYLKRGGSLLTAVGVMAPVENLGKMLEKFGIKYQQDFLILPPDDVRASIFGQANVFVTEFDELSPVTKDFAGSATVAMMFGNTRSLDKLDDNVNKFKVSLAGKTSDMVVRVRDVKEPKDLEGLSEERWEVGSFGVLAVANGKPNAPATANNDKAEKKEGDVRADAAASDEATKTHEARIVAVGSTGFLTNAGVREPINRDLFMNISNYLVQDEDFIAIRPRDPTKTTLDLSSNASQLSLLVLSFIYPFMFLGGGTLGWLRRRRA